MSSRALFNEALLCYSAGAYRAAVVFSYLGLLRLVAHRLMASSPPVGFPEALWQQVQRDLREDQKWETTAYDNLIRSKPASLFLIGDELRAEVSYWRARRNDAAHARTNEIAAPHVESLWLFVRSNARKLVVAGGREGLLERFKRHLDPSYSPRGADMFPLVAEIPQAVRSQEFLDFLRDVLMVTGDIDSPESPP